MLHSALPTQCCPISVQLMSVGKSHFVSWVRAQCLHDVFSYFDTRRNLPYLPCRANTRELVLIHIFWAFLMWCRLLKLCYMCFGKKYLQGWPKIKILAGQFMQFAGNKNNIGDNCWSGIIVGVKALLLVRMPFLSNFIFLSVKSRNFCNWGYVNIGYLIDRQMNWRKTQSQMQYRLVK